jgi:hypothetical protein
VPTAWPSGRQARSVDESLHGRASDDLVGLLLCSSKLPV